MPAVAVGESNEFAGVWTKSLNSEDLSEGVLGVGIVKEVVLFSDFNTLKEG